MATSQSKGGPGFWNFQAGTVTGTMWIVWGIPGPANNKNGDNPYLNTFPGLSNKPAPSLDYVKVKGTAANFQADVDGSNVPIAQQPQQFTTSITNGPVTTYPITSGFLGMKISDPTAQNTRDVNGAFYFNGPNFALYVGFVTGSCLGSATLPLNLA
ncbi:hypothetical protein CDV36_006234 [Fusarium kuroshium]|uniref:Uncharacterized protein n=1 Tax=Fusarium kuroshium TaxID=2010991 RepID=A0A3M2SA99_9HYPO|nr:hypothetical protein CDV36_006234 [Fusarium kuroshium]